MTKMENLSREQLIALLENHCDIKRMSDINIDTHIEEIINTSAVMKNSDCDYNYYTHIDFDELRKSLIIQKRKVIFIYETTNNIYEIYKCIKSTTEIEGYNYNQVKNMVDLYKIFLTSMGLTSDFPFRSDQYILTVNDKFLQFINVFKNMNTICNVKK